MATTIGARLRKARLAAGLTAKELGKHLGREPQTVFRWEWGDSEPSIDMLRRAARRCGCSFAWLMTGEGSMEPSRRCA